MFYCFIVFCLTGCATNRIPVELLHQRLAKLENHAKKLDGNKEDTLQNTKSSKKEEAELRKVLTELTRACNRIEQVLERERIIRIEIEKEKNPRDYQLYLDMRKKFE